MSAPTFSPQTSFALQCPIPISEYPTVTLAHGGGGRLTQMLIEKMFVPAFRNEPAGAARLLPTRRCTTARSLDLRIGAQRLAFSTDSFVISPRFFPGGDIGSLAVHGTVNDLAMCGAQPLALSAGFILEEGLPMDELWRIVQSLAEAARGRSACRWRRATRRWWTAAKATASTSTRPASA